jgi:hypothetical protein
MKFVNLQNKYTTKRLDSNADVLRDLTQLINEMNQIVTSLNNKNSLDDAIDSAITLSNHVYEKFKDLYLKA